MLYTTCSPVYILLNIFIGTNTFEGREKAREREGGREEGREGKEYLQLCAHVT